MKIRPVFNVCVMAVTVLLLTAADDSFPRRYDQQKGIVRYRINGPQRQGRAIVYFDRWGMREAKYTRCVVPRMGQENILRLVDGAWLYEVDLGKRIGQKKCSVPLQRFISQGQGEGPWNWTRLLVQQQEARQMGEQIFLGKKCAVWELPRSGQKIWFWNWIPLRIESLSPAGTDLVAATQIDVNVVFSEDMFVVPTDIHFVNDNIKNIILSRR